MNADSGSNMNSFWNNLYDQYRDRRYAALFLAILFIFLGLSIFGVMLCLHTNPLDWSEDFVAVCFGVGVSVAALVWRAIRRLRARRRNLPTSVSLSRDELTKARSKLAKERTFRKL